MKTNTDAQYKEQFDLAQSIFESKLGDYNASFLWYRPSSLTDKLFIKANRIRSLQIQKEQLVEGKGNSIKDEFQGILNYAICSLMQLEIGNTIIPESVSKEKILASFKKYRQAILELMQKKNHDYGEAWRQMRIPSITDEILVKIIRIRQMESNGSGSSEGIDQNYMDIANYALFALILIEENK
ncbi:DUF1599 domain-containing protein [Candidatus Nomurabacteria bacterium]|nr:MAG: DUF1599 domain-containing protein [Candidatus Nomurabacteria bacterium]